MVSLNDLYPCFDLVRNFVLSIIDIVYWLTNSVRHVPNWHYLYWFSNSARHVPVVVLSCLILDYGFRTDGGDVVGAATILNVHVHIHTTPHLPPCSSYIECPEAYSPEDPTQLDMRRLECFSETLGHIQHHQWNHS